MEKDLKKLLEDYVQNRCTEEERLQLEMWFARIGEIRKGHVPDDETVRRIMDNIQRSPQFAGKSQHSTKLVRLMRNPFYVAASIAVVFFFLGALFFRTHVNTPDLTVQETAVIDIQPAGDKAFLTLSNGEKIALSQVDTGVFAKQGPTRIIKNGMGEITYATGKIEPRVQGSSDNTIETPRGGQFQITLPDGSKAWLNASSSITFPVPFDPNERRVEVSGEVYFDVAKATKDPVTGAFKRIPFVVETSGQHIEVLGTQFNVQAYTDEVLQRVTLLSGSVRVHHLNSGNHIVLKPGQQAQTGDHIEVLSADMEREMAWKNGDFVFRSEMLSSILRDVSRWYAVDVECPQDIAHIRFNGMVSRNKPLSSVIEMMEATGKVKLILKGRRLIAKSK